MKSDEPLVLREAEPLADQARRLQAFAVIGVSERQGSARHAVKAQHQLFGAAMNGPVRRQTLGERGDVARVVVVSVDEAQLGHVANASRPQVDGVVDARRGGRRILRVERQHQHAGHTFGLQLVEYRSDRGRPVAHRVAHRHRVAALAEVAAEQPGLLFRPELQRRTLGRPDAGVLLRRLRGPRPKNHAVQDQPPEGPRNLHDARVAQELGEVAAHGLGRRRFRCAEIAKEHGGAHDSAVAICRFGGEAHPGGQGFRSKSGWRCGWVSANFRISKRTLGLAASDGVAPSPITPLPCRVQVPRRRPITSGS